MKITIKTFLSLIFVFFVSQIIFATSLEILSDTTIAANSNFSDNAGGYGIYFTTDTADYANVYLQGNITLNKNEKGIYCGNYGTLNFQKATTEDVTIYTSSNSRVGIQSQFVKDCYQATTISINNININSDNDNIGLFTCGTMNIVANSNDKKTINIKNPLTAAIQVNAGGTFNCENMNITGNADNFFLLTGKTSSTTFKNTAINIDASVGFLSQKDDGIYFINSSFKNKQEHFLTSQEKDFSSYNAEIIADNSVIEGYIDNKSNRNKVNFTLKNNSVWKMKKNSTVDNLNISNSKIDLTASTSTLFNSSLTRGTDRSAGSVG